MTIKYYNLKEEREDIMGVVILVNSELPANEGISEFSGNYLDFKPAVRETDYQIYDVFETIHYAGSPIAGIPSLAISSLPGVPIGSNKKKQFQLKVGLDSELEVLTKRGYKVFISEISVEKAKKMQEGAKYWEMQRDWIIG